jgi:hypothetical protein
MNNQINNETTGPASFIAVFSDNTHVTKTMQVAEWSDFCKVAAERLIEHINQPGSRALRAFHYAFGSDHGEYLPSEVDEVIFAVHS